MTVMSFDHIHLYTADPAATLAFWCGALGAERVGALGDITLLILGGQFIAVSEFPPDIEPRDPPADGHGAVRAGFGVAHVGLNVDDLRRLLPRLEAAGARAHGAVRDQPPVRFVYLTGPDGVVIELTQYVLPAKLRPAGVALAGFNRAVHIARRTIGRALIAAATR